ncbi:pimeloyl-ACP methyl ester carboxylesterase [Thermocatellispora tengchongensis]|uniref:Pimeloyl-ACP methyl ester carboxylesterase n=1 Tax=Thermocatellispora tengchongensis TaxID=1073253 RepID=A0A840PSU4_9ACTN|nr:alpha/beta fold hydrolase [Thermocatellispora tengchongensis]MBB5140207.1 pimeloyl-ACP methyl ester carboxylesterase [Thermocatellispora tengchongensis]
MRISSRVLSALLLAVVVAGALQAPAGAARQSLEWVECGDGMQCAKLTVPIDWKRPDGPKTRVDLARLPAREPGRKLGSLVVNTGGGATIQPVRGTPAVVSELTTWFDVVLIDPRGMGDRGSSTAVECDRPQAGIGGLILNPTAAGWRAQAKANAAYDASCRAAMGAAYAGLTSWQVAHDLEALRVALGEPRLRYFGNSYGTVYGQAYLELFPAKAGRMVLDGVADHTRPSLERWLLDHARTEEAQLRRFRDWCAAGCALGDDDAIEVFDELLARTPLPAGEQTVSRQQFLLAVKEGLAPPAWPRLAAALRKAADGDASDLARLKPLPPESPGHPHGAMLCHDFMPDVPGYREFRAMESRLRQAAPRIGWIHGRYQLARCVGMGGEPANPPRPLRAKGAPPVLIAIGDTDDNTPNLGAEHVAAQIPGARVVRHGDGHAAYLLHSAAGMGDTCLRRHVHDYLTAGTLPAPGARCPGDLLARIPRG